MSEIQELQQELPIAKIAQQAGVSEDEARQAIDAVLPALVGGMQANAEDPAGSASLERALGDHRGALQQRLAGDVDAADGAKIVDNVFGGSTDRIATALGGDGALGQIIRKVLPIVAPIVLAWLAERIFGGGSKGQSSQAQQPAGAPTPASTQSGDNPFGNSGSSGGSQATPQQQSKPEQSSSQQQTQPDLGGILGDLLGGGSKGGGLGDLLGGLLGGGKR